MGDSSAKMLEGFRKEREFMEKVRQCGGFDIEHLMKAKPGRCNFMALEITKDKPAPGTSSYMLGWGSTSTI
ncbi:unnamed protein product [Brassica napus]|uniref:(rape) hypothetical protein n=1 Tax=Brassica napus TaxID=3708 RepID=A0A816K9Z3_BRANA|nr:unnamed protein product [Brassica napus]